MHGPSVFGAFSTVLRTGVSSVSAGVVAVGVWRTVGLEACAFESNRTKVASESAYTRT